MRSHRNESGQVVPLAALALVLLGAAAYGIVAVGVVLIDRATARTAADAVALELAAGLDEESAEGLAAEHGGEVVWVRWDGPTVEVQVRVGGSTARSRATSSVEWVPPGGARSRGAIP